MPWIRPVSIVAAVSVVGALVILRPDSAGPVGVLIGLIAVLDQILGKGRPPDIGRGSTEPDPPVAAGGQTDEQD